MNLFSPMCILDGKKDISYLDNELLVNELLQIKDASFYKGILQEDLAMWCYNHGVYGLPTTELIEWLKDQMVEGKTVEIGAGMGTIGRALKIPITDSCIMNDPVVSIYYKSMGQPTTKYPNDIIKLSAIDTISTYKPINVIASWVTQIYKDEDGANQSSSVFGVDEDFILDNVKKYILIGHKKIHGTKRILKREHKEYQFPWLYSRSMSVNENIIYVWEKV